MRWLFITLVVVRRGRGRDGVGLEAPAAAHRHPGMPFKRVKGFLMYLPGERGERGPAGFSEPLMGQMGQRGRPIGDPRRSCRKTRRSIWETERSIWETQRSIWPPWRLRRGTRKPASRITALRRLRGGVLAHRLDFVGPRRTSAARPSGDPLRRTRKRPSPHTKAPASRASRKAFQLVPGAW